MHRPAWAWIFGLTVLLFLVPGFQGELQSVFEPPEGGGGSGCFECGVKEIPIEGGGVLIIDPACVPAPFAAPQSGRDCSIDVSGEFCLIEDLCQFA